MLNNKPPKRERVARPVNTSAAHRRLGVWIEFIGRVRGWQNCPKGRVGKDLHLVFCLEGRGQLNLDGVFHDIGAGDLIFMPFGKPHHYASDNTGDWQSWWIHFDGHYARHLITLAGMSLNRPVLRIDDVPAIDQAFQRVFDIAAAARSDCGYASASALIDCLIRVIAQRGISKEAERFTDRLSWRTPNVETAAADAGYSKFHYIREFRKAVGRTPWQYILELKITRAKELLISTNTTNKELAAELGFSDGNYFGQVFRRIVGQPPGKYRHAYRAR